MDDECDGAHALKWRRKVFKVSVAVASTVSTVFEDLEAVQVMTSRKRKSVEVKVRERLAEISETVSIYSRILSEAVGLFEEHPCILDEEKRRLQPMILCSMNTILLIRFYLDEISHLLSSTT